MDLKDIRIFIIFKSFIVAKEGHATDPLNQPNVSCERISVSYDEHMSAECKNHLFTTLWD